MNDEQQPTLTVLYCRNVPGSTEKDRQALEQKHGKHIRLFPIPCSGRLEPVHLLRALEEVADVAYVITCPEGACRYFEGNKRARKRVERTRSIIASIGLEKERIGIIIGSSENPETLSDLVEAIMERTAQLTPSPVLKRPQSAEEVRL